MDTSRPLRILYLGAQGAGATSRHRCEALRRLGHEVVAFDPGAAVTWSRVSGIFHYRTGYVLAARRISSALAQWLAGQRGRFDVGWVDNGAMINAAALRGLRQRAARVVNYNCDDPTGRRDGNRFFTLRRNLPRYDLCAVMREPNVQEYLRRGARKVRRVWMAADEVAHRPRPLTPDIRARWANEVAFVGTWMPERGPLMTELIRGGIKVAIWGLKWQKDPEWAVLRSCWRGGTLEGDDYAYAIQCATLNLGLVSIGNRDGHTQRSMEIPALGGLLCAKRTSEHVSLYEEGVEAVFWDDGKDCARTIRRLISDPRLLAGMGDRGRVRAQRNRHFNEPTAEAILADL